MKVDEKQVGGTHYKMPNPDQEHWNLVTAHGWDYFTAQVIKYVMRWKSKGGVDDLKKAQHFLEKLIELQMANSIVGPKHTGYQKDPAVGEATPIDQFKQVGGYSYLCMKCGTVIHGASSPGDAYRLHGECAGRGYVAQ